MRLDDTRTHDEVLGERRRIVQHQGSLFDRMGDESFDAGYRCVLVNAGCPSPLVKWVLTDFDDGVQMEARVALRAMLTGDSVSTGVALLGATRTAKTSLACAALRIPVRNGESVLFRGYEQFIHFFRQRVDWMQMNNRTQIDDLDDLMNEWYEQRWRWMNVYDVMVLDDIGRVPAPDFMRQEMLSVLRARADAGAKTIVTSNLTAEQLTAQFDQRTVEFLRSEYDVINFGPTAKVA